MLRIVVPGVARGKGRPRMTRSGRVYTPKATVNAEAWIRQCAVQQVGQPALEGPLSVAIQISVAVPQSWSKKKREEALSGKTCPTGKPDLDNTTKALLDALNGIVWRDDAQVVHLTVAKSYADKSETAMTIASVTASRPSNNTVDDRVNAA